MLYAHRLAAVGEQRLACWLLHGFLGSGRNLLSYGKGLVEQCPNVGIGLLDLPGHGQSEPIGREATLDSMAETVWQTMDALAPQARHVVIGHSFGGRIGMRLQYHYPKQIEQLLLLDIGPAPLLHMDAAMELLVQQLLAAPHEETSRAAMRARLLHPNLSEHLIDWVLRNGKTMADGRFMWQINRATLCAVQQRERLRDLWPDSKPLAARWTCVVGGLSSFVHPATVTLLQQAGATVQVWPNIGHHIHVEALTELVAYSGAWLRSSL